MITFVESITLSHLVGMVNTNFDDISIEWRESKETGRMVLRVYSYGRVVQLHYFDTVDELISGIAWFVSEIDYDDKKERK